MVRFDLRTKLNELERVRDTRYGYADIAAATKNRLSRQTARQLLKSTPKRVDTDTLAALLDFFAAEGMPISVGDLFAVSHE